MKKNICLVLVPVFTNQLGKLTIRKWTDNEYYINKGIIDGLFSNSPFIILVLNLLVIYLIVYLLRHLKYKQFQKVFLYLLLGGVLSNFIDKLFIGGVVDYIQIGVLNAFNFADIFILLFIIALVGLSLFKVVINKRVDNF